MESVELDDWSGWSEFKPSFTIWTHTFVQANPGVGLVDARLFRHAESSRIRARVRFGDRAMGPEGIAHGGCIAALLDEVIGVACAEAGLEVLLTKLEVEFLRAVPVNTEHFCEATLGEELGFSLSGSAVLWSKEGFLNARARAGYVFLSDEQKMAVFGRTDVLRRIE